MGKSLHPATRVGYDVVTLGGYEDRKQYTYFGFDTGQKATLEATAQTAGLTRERVRQIIASALAKLRADPAVAVYKELFSS